MERRQDVQEQAEGLGGASQVNRVVCPNFGHPALTSSIQNTNFWEFKNSLAKIVNELSVLRLLQLSNGDLLFL